MPSKQYWKKYISLETPAIYRIRVNGSLDESWSDRLAGMGITSISPENDGPITTLVGSLRDQAELVGVLNNLYELHLPILTVEILKSTSYDDEEVVEKFDMQDNEGEK